MFSGIFPGAASGLHTGWALAVFFACLVGVLCLVHRWTCGRGCRGVHPSVNDDDADDNSRDERGKRPCADADCGGRGGDGSGEAPDPRGDAADNCLTDAAAIASEAGVDEALVGKEEGAAPVWETCEDAVTGEVNADWVDVRVGAVAVKDFSGLVVVDCEVRPAGRCADEKIGTVVRVRLHVPDRTPGFGFFHTRKGL